MTREDVPEVVALHAGALGGTLAALGPGVLETWYRHALESSHHVAYALHADGRFAGFVMGASNPPLFRRDLFQRRILGLLTRISLGALHNPRAGLALVKSVFGERPDYDPEVPELIYLAVHPETEGQGFGKTLVEAFAASKQLPAGHFELSVEKSNDRALAFYRNIGFTEVKAYEEFGREYLRLSRNCGS
jgi:ribosomal protein S18 acetylase RimI-like enzyme